LKERNPTPFELPPQLTNTTAYEQKRGTSHPKTQKDDFEVLVGTFLHAVNLYRTAKKFKERNPWAKGKANTPLMFLEVPKVLEQLLLDIFVS